MGSNDDLLRLIANLSPADPADAVALRDAGLAFHFEWPADYDVLMGVRNGGAGRIGKWWVQLWSVEDLVTLNRLGRDDETTLVAFGGDGGNELLAFERESGDVWLVPVIGDRGDWIRLGATITEAFQRFEHDDVFGAARR